MGNLFASDRKVPSSVVFDFNVKNPLQDEGEVAAGESKSPGEAPEAAAAVTKAMDFVGEAAAKLRSLEGSKSSQDVQQKAMRSLDDKTLQQDAFQASVKIAELLIDFLEYAKTMESTAAEVLTVCVSLYSANATSNKEQQDKWVRENSRIIKCVCDMMHFALKFDLMKQMKPELMNDFAYYRRNIGKFGSLATVKEQSTNEISMWFANANPMLMRLINAVSTVFAKDQKGLKIFMALIAKGCCSMLMRGDCATEEEQMYCMHVMTAALISFDHVHPVGVFKKSSGFETRKCVLQLKSDKYMELDTMGLLNSIRFSTKHYRSPDTPASLKRLIEA